MIKIKKQLEKLEDILKTDITMLKGSLYKTKQKYISKKEKNTNKDNGYDIYLFTYFKSGKHFSKYIKKKDYAKVNKYWQNYLKYYNEKKRLKKYIDEYFKKLNNYEKKNLIDIKSILTS